jgi:hypothetical protein
VRRKAQQLRYLGNPPVAYYVLVQQLSKSNSAVRTQPLKSEVRIRITIMRVRLFTSMRIRTLLFIEFTGSTDSIKKIYRSSRQCCRSGAFLTPGSGKCFFQDSASQTHIFQSLEIFLPLLLDSGSGMNKNQDLGTGINIPEPHHSLQGSIVSLQAPIVSFHGLPQLWSL